jgi:hypothetical protein
LVGKEFKTTSIERRNGGVRGRGERERHTRRCTQGDAHEERHKGKGGNQDIIVY